MKQIHDRSRRLELGEAPSTDHQTSLADMLVVAQKLDAVIPAPTDTGRDLDMIRREQKTRIAARINSGKPLDLTGLAEKIYPKPTDPKLPAQVEDLRASQEARLKHKEREFVEKKKSNELLQQFVNENHKKIEQAFSNFHVVYESLLDMRNNFLEFTKNERLEYKALTQKAIHILHDISVLKEELFASIQFAQDHGVAHVSLPADKLAQYHEESLNCTRIGQDLRMDLSFDPVRDLETMKLLEETEGLEEAFRNMLDRNLHILRPDEDEKTRTRSTQDVRQEFFDTRKRMNAHQSAKDSTSIISSVLEDRFNKLDFVLKNRMRNEKK